MTTLKEKRAADKKLMIPLVLMLFPIGAIIAFYLLSRDRSFANAAVSGFAYPLRDLLGKLTAPVPFSLMEVIDILAVLFVPGFIIASAVKIMHSTRRFYTLYIRLSTIILLILTVFSGYLWIWNIDYKSDTFAEKNGLSDDGITADELCKVTAFFVSRANSLADTVPRDENGHFSSKPEDYFPLSLSLYDNIAKEFPCLSGECHMPKKVFFSKVMSKLGFTGMYFAATGESNINTDSPAAFIPSTIGHELAHQLGVWAEQEANFVGIAACLSSEQEVYVYSGYLSGSVYLMNALYDADKEAWRTLRESFAGGFLTDWEDDTAYWDSNDSTVTEVSQTVYDSYLKSAGLEDGIESYGECVDLLVNYYIDKI